MYLVKKTFDNRPEFLMSEHYQNISCTVSDAGLNADENGRKYVYGGTLLDENGKKVKITRSGTEGDYSYAFSEIPVGILFGTIDVTHGEQPGALMIDGSVNVERLQGDYIVEAVQEIIPKLPFIKFFVDGKLLVKE